MMGPVTGQPALENGSLPGLHGGGYGRTGVRALLMATSEARQPGPIPGSNGPSNYFPHVRIRLIYERL